MRKELEEVLKKVNEARAAFGQEPLEDLPKGILSDACQCPLARALPRVECVGIECITCEGASDAEKLSAVFNEKPYYSFNEFVVDTSFMTPVMLQTFIDRFDSGHYPELIEAAEESHA